MSEYTVDQINEAGVLLSGAALETIERTIRADNPYRSLVALPGRKPTRRERLRWRLADYRYRVASAIEMLRGRHDCGGY